jgi:putative oxidoreductase
VFDSLAKNALAPLVLRLMLAAIFIYHGWMLVAPANDWGFHWMPGVGPKPPAAARFAVAWGELIGGVALGLGFLTRLAALGLIVIMAGAIYLVHLPHGFDIRNQGFEYNLAIIAMCLVLVLVGGGRLAVDHLFSIRRRRTRS